MAVMMVRLLIDLSKAGAETPAANPVADGVGDRSCAILPLFSFRFVSRCSRGAHHSRELNTARLDKVALTMLQLKCSLLVA
jgi:hypothetical protein